MFIFIDFLSFFNRNRFTIDCFLNWFIYLNLQRLLLMFLSNLFLIRFHYFWNRFRLLNVNYFLDIYFLLLMILIIWSSGKFNNLLRLYNASIIINIYFVDHDWFILIPNYLARIDLCNITFMQNWLIIFKICDFCLID